MPYQYQRDNRRWIETPSRLRQSLRTWGAAVMLLAFIVGACWLAGAAQALHGAHP